MSTSSDEKQYQNAGLTQEDFVSLWKNADRPLTPEEEERIRKYQRQCWKDALQEWLTGFLCVSSVFLMLLPWIVVIVLLAMWAKGML